MGATVDSRVLANIASSTSSSFLKHVISVGHGRNAGKILRVAPQTMSSVLPTLMPVSSAKRKPRADAKVGESVEKSVEQLSCTSSVIVDDSFVRTLKFTN